MFIKKLEGSFMLILRISNHKENLIKGCANRSSGKFTLHLFIEAVN